MKFGALGAAVGGVVGVFLGALIGGFWACAAAESADERNLCGLTAIPGAYLGAVVFTPIGAHMACRFWVTGSLGVRVPYSRSELVRLITNVISVAAIGFVGFGLDLWVGLPLFPLFVIPIQFVVAIRIATAASQRLDIVSD